MRVLPLSLLILTAACHARSAPGERAAAAAGCELRPNDSLWLDTAIRGWRSVGEPRLHLPANGPLPHLILFDPRCTHDVDVASSWNVRNSAHDGRVRLPNGLAIRPIGIAITSPTADDRGIFLALALPESWRADPRYRGTNDSRESWERYLVGAFTHEMTHARMLPGRIGQLRALEASIFPDTIEDNLVQARFGRQRDFAQAVARETDWLYRAARAPTTNAQREYARAALLSIRERRQRYFVGDFANWGDVEQTFLDLEGVAQWAAFGHDPASRTRGTPFDRALGRFRATREFWSEDQGLAMILALDALVPDWQRRLISATPVSSFELLTDALAGDR